MKSFINWCRRYFSLTLLASIAVASLVLFFNEHSLLRTMAQEREIDRLEELISQATDTLNYYKELNRSLDTDAETMERIVREQYHMQHPDEDVYVYE